jgi:outer membrane protein OmpA-like peptidoglycan-associated protein
MKKAFITAIAFLVVSSAAMAAGEADSTRYLETTFKQNWFISADVSINWWQGSDRNPNGNYTAVQWNKPSFGGSINLGKWINHKFGLRLSYDVNQGKSYIDGLHANRPFINFLYDGTFHYDDNYINNGQYTYEGGTPPDENGYYNTTFMHHSLHVDAFLSPIDLFQGYYNPYRVYTPVIYAGMGFATVSEKILFIPDLINNAKNKGNEFAQKGVNFEYCFNAGLINNFRISDHFDLHLDLKLAMQRWNIDTWFYEMGGLTNYEGATSTDNIRPKQFDMNYSIGFGVVYYFSRIYELPNNCCEEMEEFKKRLAECKEELANAPKEQTTALMHDTIVKYAQTEDIISYPFSIFFNLDSYQLMSRRDLVNLREIAEVAKANGYKLRLRGSCDSATASAAYNQTLSENRCRKIMMELMEMGIPESQIIMMPMGGVQELDPTEYDRRVLIELVKEAPKN